MVFFVLTNDGGVMQYLGLALFILQVVDFSGLWRDFQTLLSSSTGGGGALLSNNIAMTITGVLAGYLTMVLWKRMTSPPPLPRQQQQGQRQDHQDPREGPGGNHHNDNNNRNDNSIRLAQMRTNLVQQLRVSLREITGMEWTDFGIHCFVVLVAGSSAVLIYLSTKLRPNWIPYLYQTISFVSIFFTIVRGGRGGNANNNAQQQQQQQRRQERRRQAKLEEMTALVSRMPLEGFVTEEATAQDVPIGKLKEMLAIRGVQDSEIKSFVERRNMVERLNQCRQYSDTCCICFEEYKEGEPLRVLSKCCHELHVECLDKWVYTFANNAAKVRQDPTCPLCKVSLK